MTIPPCLQSLDICRESLRFFTASLVMFLVTTFSLELCAATPDPSKLTTTVWAANGMTKDPVALAFDHRGRLFTVETARRATVDIDIRSHRDWLLDDLASDDFASMRDFFRRRMASHRSEENKSWLRDRNGDGVHDYRDLTTISERVRLIQDTDNDGVADKSTLFADDFCEEFTGVAAGVLPYGNDVFLTVYPDLWRLTDSDGDGVAEKRESLFRGFGVHAAFDGHDLHGLTVGPEGKIYFSCGDNGFSVRTKEGQLLHHPNTGGVLRMEPDGTKLEVFAIGLRNVQEFDFDKYGNMFAVDNDGDLEDERERTVYIAEGSDSGWRTTWQFRSAGWAKFNGNMTYNPWTAEGMWKPFHADQPAHITPPMANYSVGPGGFKFNPGTGLGPDYRDFFFCVQFPVKQVTAFRTQPRGAGFEMRDEHVFHTGLMVSSVNFGPDGGLFLADWIGKWQPNGEGIVYRVDDPTTLQSPERMRQRNEIQQLLQNGLLEHSDDSIVDLLGHDDRRIRRLSQTELVRRKKTDRLLREARNGDADELARIHALWGLIQLNDSEVNQSLSEKLPWRDANAQIRQQCARVAGELSLAGSKASLIEQIRDPSPLVRSHAAIALGKVGSANSLSPLVDLLRRTDNADPFIRHAAVMGLAHSATSQSLLEYRDSPSAAVRLGIVLALRKQRHPDIATFFHDNDTRVLREAVRGAHDDLSIADALPALAELLDLWISAEEHDVPGKLFRDEPILRRVISANLRVGSAECAERLARFALHEFPTNQLLQSLQIEALECLAVWSQTPLIDRVEGRIRKTQRTDPSAGKRALSNYIPQLLASRNAKIASQAVEIAYELKLPIDETQLAANVQDSIGTDRSELMVSALQVLDQRDSQLLPDLLDRILDGDWTKEHPIQTMAFEILVRRDPKTAFALGVAEQSTTAKRAFITQLPQFGTDAADHHLESLLKKAPESQPELMPEVLAAGIASPKASIRKLARERVDQFRGDPLGEYQFSSQAGNALKGKTIYLSHVSAQCVRCHNAGGAGKQAGPVLTGIASRLNKDLLLESLVNPSAKIAKGFDSVTIELDDGRLISGSIANQDDGSITIGETTGKTTTLAHGRIEEIVTSNQSAMPSMRGVLTPIEVRDVVSYLSTIK